jgi:hypothetical protein
VKLSGAGDSRPFTLALKKPQVASAHLHRKLALSHTYTQEFYMTPYELRFSVFNAAKDFLEQQYKANLAVWEALDTATKNAAELAPKFPTMEEIIEKSIEINKFVSDANERELTKVVKRVTGMTVAF